jgi:hypothetical protein
MPLFIGIADMLFAFGAVFWWSLCGIFGAKALPATDLAY